MNFYLGVTDINWYKNLSKIKPEDVNFWQPGGRNEFRRLTVGEPFLFKLKSPYNVIGGVGFFTNYILLPLNIAWETFEVGNGFSSFTLFRNAIMNLRKDKSNLNPQIGCIVLTDPIFFEEKDWIEIPDNWKSSIVQGKTYDTSDSIAKIYWERVEFILNSYLERNPILNENSLVSENPDSPLYGNPVLTKVRKGQGSFKVSIINAYNKRCSISGERTMPVLEAAHIKPISRSGPNYIRNGLLLRSDIHKLFDSGYITITKDLKIEVSKKIKEEYENGKEYYQFDGKNLFMLPVNKEDKPYHEYVGWHNENVYRG